MSKSEVISFRVFGVEAETPKAWLFWLSKNHDTGARAWVVWFSKKECILEGDIEDGILTVPLWLYKKKKLDEQNFIRSLEVVI